MGFPGLLFTATALLIFAAFAGTAQKNAPRNTAFDWPMFNRDLAGARYSPPSRINRKNVGNLNVAWTYKLRPHDGKPLTGQGPSEIFQEVTIYNAFVTVTTETEERYA